MLRPLAEHIEIVQGKDSVRNNSWRSLGAWRPEWDMTCTVRSEGIAERLRDRLLPDGLRLSDEPMIPTER